MDTREEFWRRVQDELGWELGCGQEMGIRGKDGRARNTQELGLNQSEDNTPVDTLTLQPPFHTSLHTAFTIIPILRSYVH